MGKKQLQTTGVNGTLADRKHDQGVTDITRQRKLSVYAHNFSQQEAIRPACTRPSKFHELEISDTYDCGS